jgi:hypothetical protein
MNEETQNSEAPESNEAPAGRTLSEDRYPVEDPGPGKPRFEPSEGTRHVYDSAKKMWMVERDPSYKDGEPSAEDQRAQAEAAAKQRDEDAETNGVYKRGGNELVLPEHMPTAALRDPEAPVLLGEVREIFTEAGLLHAAQQRLIDVFAEEYIEERNGGAPATWNESAVLGQLKQQWGPGFESRLALAQKAARSFGQPFLKWLGDTGAGNAVSILNALALYGDGTLSMTPDKAAAKLAEMRANKTGPLMNSFHPEHRVALSQARALSMHLHNAVSANEDQGKTTLKNMVGNRLDAEARAKGKTVDEATEKMNDRVRAIRSDPNYWKKDNAGLHRSLVDEMQSLMRQLHGEG